MGVGVCTHLCGRGGGTICDGKPKILEYILKPNNTKMGDN